MPTALLFVPKIHKNRFYRLEMEALCSRIK